VDELIAVTGGTGALGRVVVDRLVDAGSGVRVVSRGPRPADDNAQYEWASADLHSGRGADEALANAGVIVHCATAFGRGKEPDLAGKVIDTAKRAGSPHLVYVSIVGVDRVPLGYYQGKLAAERLIEQSGLPHTILRATQFHDLLRVLFAGAAKVPAMPVPELRFQPIDVRDVAARLAELALGDPLGRAPDIGGPQVRDATDLARAYLLATGRRRPVLPVRLPGAVFRSYRRGGHLTPEHATGEITFEQYLAEHPDPRGVSYRGKRR
jgi:uncharacterized protein YbjT (DUF2867 family)